MSITRYTTRNSHAIRFRDDGTFTQLSFTSIYLSIYIYLSASPTGVLFREMRTVARTTFPPSPVHPIRSPPPKSFLSRHTLPEKLAVWRFHIFLGRQLRAHIPQATTARRRRSSYPPFLCSSRVACIVSYPHPKRPAKRPRLRVYEPTY